VATGWAADEDSGRATLLAMEGHTAVVPSEDDVAAWRAAAEPMWDRWAEGVRGAGHDADQLWADLMAEIEARGAAY
jgi:hypothetical protein